MTKTTGSVTFHKWSELWEVCGTCDISRIEPEGMNMTFLDLNLFLSRKM